jgi:hypothetical protein
VLVATVVAGRLIGALARDVELHLVGEYLRIWRRYRRSGVPGIGLIQFVGYAAVHWHGYRYYKHARDDGRQIYNTYAYSRQPAASAPDAPS